MAKLTAHGQVELLRVTYEAASPELSSTIDYERVEKAYMDNGRILSKRTVCFKPSGERHNWGWKVVGKVKQGIKVSDIIAIYNKKQEKETIGRWIIEVRCGGEFKTAEVKAKEHGL